MNWPRMPWQPKIEQRESGGDFRDAVVRAIEQAAAGGTADANATAALEVASGALSRAFMGAQVVGPTWAMAAISPEFLGQVGRDLIRRGSSMHTIEVDDNGKVLLLPTSNWHFEGSDHPSSWTVRATNYGPSTSTTRLLPYDGVVYLRWGSSPGTPYVGTSPASWASTTNKMLAESQRSMGEEAAGPLAQLLTVPSDGGDDGDEDPLKELKADIRAARGRALLLETTAAGYGEGRGAAPQRDWMPARLGPNPPPTMPEISRDAFAQMLEACGTPSALFMPGADGTSQREAARRYLGLTLKSYGALLAWELTQKLETAISLSFDQLYFSDSVGRSVVLQRAVQSGMTLEQAIMVSGLGE